MQETTHEEYFASSPTHSDAYGSLKLINDSHHVQKDLERRGGQIFVQSPDLICLESWNAIRHRNESEREISVRLTKRVISSDQDLKSYLEVSCVRKC